MIRTVRVRCARPRRQQRHAGATQGESKALPPAGDAIELRKHRVAPVPALVRQRLRREREHLEGKVAARSAARKDQAGRGGNRDAGSRRARKPPGRARRDPPGRGKLGRECDPGGRQAIEVATRAPFRRLVLPRGIEQATICEAHQDRVQRSRPETELGAELERGLGRAAPIYCGEVRARFCCEFGARAHVQLAVDLREGSTRRSRG